MLISNKAESEKNLHKHENTVTKLRGHKLTLQNLTLAKSMDQVMQNDLEMRGQLAENERKEIVTRMAIRDVNELMKQYENYGS